MVTKNTTSKSKSKGLVALLTILLLVSIFTLTPNPANMQTVSNVQPALLAMAAEQPDTAVRLIIQKSDPAANIEAAVTHMDGTVIKELKIINSVVAEMEAESAVDLSFDASVNWVKLDTQYFPSITSDANTVRDEFNAYAYNNNDGTVNWASNWAEIGDDNNPASGDALIYDNELLLRSPNNGWERTANLSNAATAVLSFDYRRHSFDTQSDYVTLEISNDNGATWTELDRLAGPISEDSFQQVTYDIVSYAAENVTIRFISSETLSRRDHFFVDNVQIEYTVAASVSPIESSDEPTLNNFLQTANAALLWEKDVQGQGVTVAVIDSGISPSKDFGDRLIAQVSFNEKAETPNDSYGHGTHVAGIIGGNGAVSDGLYQGVAPQVNLIGLKVSDDTGMAYESDTVAALQWVLENKDKYNIRVVNLSLNSTLEQTYHESAVDLASELLWFNGVVVVASAGNRSLDGNFYTITASPANDPFIITVGASLENGTSDPADDYIGLFSAHGKTVDGFVKPDIIAPGYNIVSVLSSDSTWAKQNPERVEGDGYYFRLSGTSMAAPIVSGAAALLLQVEPNLTPDQVKYRLINSGSKITPIWFDAILDKTIYPYLDVYTAVDQTSLSADTANQGIMPHMALAQMALIAYWANENSVDTVDWNNVDLSAVDWDAVDWDAVDWDAVDWEAVDWGSVNWGSVNWGSVNWGSVNWGSVNWGSVSWNE